MLTDNLVGCLWFPGAAKGRTFFAVIFFANQSCCQVIISTFSILKLRSEQQAHRKSSMFYCFKSLFFPSWQTLSSLKSNNLPIFLRKMQQVCNSLVGKSHGNNRYRMHTVLVSPITEKWPQNGQFFETHFFVKIKIVL